MGLGRNIATATVAVVCGLALAACGEQIAAHVDAADSVHSAFTSLVNSPTTRLVITGQNLPGRASIVDGSFSLVVTASKENGAGSASYGAVDISVYHQSTNLVDLRELKGSAYLRVDVRDLSAFESPGSYAKILSAADELAGHRPGLGFVHDILVGKWVGISSKTLVRVGASADPFDNGFDTRRFDTDPEPAKGGPTEGHRHGVADAVNSDLVEHSPGGRRRVLPQPSRSTIRRILPP